MTKEATKPTHQLVKYYGTGRNAPRANVGAVFTKEDGSLSIRLDTPTEQIWLNGFKIKDDQSDNS